MDIHERIRKRRSEIKKNLADVAEEIGINTATLSRYESGEIQNMGIDKVEPLAKALQCSTGYIMGWTESIGDSSQSSIHNEEMVKIIHDKKAEPVFKVLQNENLRQRLISYARYLLSEPEE